MSPARRDPVERFWEKVDKREPGECWEWIAPRTKDGYGYLAMGRTSVRAHRYSWELANGPIPDGLHVCHSCDNPSCVHPTHLWLCTNAENVADRDRKGRQDRVLRRGMLNRTAKLTDQQVQVIRVLIKIGCFQQEIGARYGISHGHVARIAARRAWSHVPDYDLETA